MRRLVGFIFCIVAFASASTSVLADSVRHVPGTTVSATVPDTFQVINGVTGLVDPSTGASFIVTELPKEAFPELERLFATVEGLNARFSRGGVHIRTIEKVQTENGHAISLAHGLQEAVSGRVDKWMGIFGGAKTALVTMQVDEQRAFDPATVRAIFASITLGQPPSQSELIARLPFSIEIVQPFRFVGAPTGSGILLTVGPSDLNTGSRQPIVMAMRQASEVKPEPLERLAESQLRSTSSFSGADISSRTQVEFAGAQGILFEGTTINDGVKSDFRQYLSVAEDGKFIRLVAGAPFGEMTRLLPTIEKIARSIKLK